MAEEGHCRMCYGGERGLADALIEPCNCRGTLAFVHVSCLHAWRMQRAVQLLDTSRCEVCGAPYHVPPAAWRAFAASAEAGSPFRVRMQALWQAAVPPLRRAASVLLLAARAVVKARHVYQWLGQSCLLCIASEEVPMRFYTLPACWKRMLPLAVENVRWMGALLLLQRHALGDWRAVRLLPTWRHARRLALVCGVYTAAALLQWACDVRWDAPGAPAKQPLGSWLADGLLQLATIVAAVHLAEGPAFWAALLGPLAPSELRGAAQAGFWVLGAANKVAAAEARRGQEVEFIAALFAQRPQALVALSAALL